MCFQGSTSEEWQTYSPKFHEGIIFKEMFPALCHRVRIAIKHRIDSFRTCVVAVHILDMAKISNSEEYGKIVKLFLTKYTKHPESWDTLFFIK